MNILAGQKLPNLTQFLPRTTALDVNIELPLTAQERTQTRNHAYLVDGQILYVHLPRGTVLRDRDILGSEDGSLQVRVVAKPEPVITVTAQTTLDLIRAAYHLGNRHIALEITSGYLRLLPDPVLKSMLIQLGVEVKEETVPFQPEIGAYVQKHEH